MNKMTLVISALMLVIGIGLGLSSTAWISADNNSDNPSMKLERKPIFYRSPMNSEITSPVPAKGPMGMDYIPVYADGQKHEIAGTIKIDPVMVHNIGVRTSTAKIKSISRTIRALGRVGFNEETMTRLHPKVDGWVEQMWVNTTGQRVRKNDRLLSLYSPKLLSTQQEYLLALNNLMALEKSPFEEIRQGAKALVKSARERLVFMDVPEHQIKELEQSRKAKKYLQIQAEKSGTVIRIGSRQGQFVTPETELYMMVDLDQVWVYADVYEYELPWVKVGDEVKMTLVSVPGKTFTGSLSYIYPYGESKTRTTKVRLVFDNHDGLLRPDLFAEVSIQSGTVENSVVIPAEAVIRSGKQPQVFIVRDSGKFEPRTVRLGLESDGEVAILDGIEAGDEVVISSQFLLDSESKLSEAAAKMMEPKKITPKMAGSEQSMSDSAGQGQYSHD